MLGAGLFTACASDSRMTAPTTTTTPEASSGDQAVHPGPSQEPRAAPKGPARAVISDRGVVLPVKARDGDGYRVTTPCSRTATVAGATPVTAATVVLDPGHGGDEEGAKGPDGLTEKAVNLAVSSHAQAALDRQGVSTVLTRTADYRVTLDTRIDVVRALRPRAFVSVHHNSEPDGPRPGPGTETYYQLASGESKRLAGLLYEEVVKALSAYQVAWVGDTDAGAKYRRNSRGGDYYAILRGSEGVPASLAELAFISNPAEASLLARPDVQQAEGEAVARGIQRFLSTSDPGSGFVEPYPRTSPAGPGGGAGGCVDPPL